MIVLNELEMNNLCSYYGFDFTSNDVFEKFINEHDYVEVWDELSQEKKYIKREAMTMLKYEVEKGHVMDMKHREGHVSEHYQLFDTLEEAKNVYTRTQASMRKDNEYVTLNIIEIDESNQESIELIDSRVLETTYMIDLLRSYEVECNE